MTLKHPQIYLFFFCLFYNSLPCVFFILWWRMNLKLCQSYLLIFFCCYLSTRHKIWCFCILLEVHPLANTMCQDTKWFNISWNHWIKIHFQFFTFCFWLHFYLWMFALLLSYVTRQGITFNEIITKNCEVEFIKMHLKNSCEKLLKSANSCYVQQKSRSKLLCKMSFFW